MLNLISFNSSKMNILISMTLINSTQATSLGINTNSNGVNRKYVFIPIKFDLEDQKIN